MVSTVCFEMLGGFEDTRLAVFIHLMIVRYFGLTKNLPSFYMYPLL